MRKLAFVLLLLCAFGAAKGNWFIDVVTGIQEGIKDSFEKAQEELANEHKQTEKHKDGVAKFLKHLDDHVTKWKKGIVKEHLFKEHFLNGSRTLNKKAKKLWKKLKHRVLTRLSDSNKTEKSLKKVLKKQLKKQEKKLHQTFSKFNGKDHLKRTIKKGKHKLNKKTKLLRVPLKKDDTVRAQRLVKAQKVFTKLADMWSKVAHRRRQDIGFSKEKAEPNEDEGPSPESLSVEEETPVEKKEDHSWSSAEELAKKMIKYGKLIEIPDLNIPKEEIMKRTAQFFKMHKLKEKETGPYMTKEDEKELSKEIRTKLVNGQERDSIAEQEAKAEEIVKKEQKKFDELEKQWRQKMEKKMREAKKELPILVKIDSISGSSDKNEDKKEEKIEQEEKDKTEAKEAGKNQQEVPDPSPKQVLILPNFKEPKTEKTSPTEQDEDELWLKFPESSEKKEKILPEKFEKMEGDLPTSLEEEEKSEDTMPEEPTVKVGPKEEVKPTMGMGIMQEMDDEGFRRKLMKEEEEWMQFKKMLVKKFNNLKEMSKRRHWDRFQGFNEEIGEKVVPFVESIANKAKAKIEYDEP